MNTWSGHLARAGAAALLGMLVVHASAQDTAREWFERMGLAVETLTYRGKLVHAHNNQLEMLEVLHKVENGRVFERVTSLNGSAREVVREGERVRCIDEQRKQVLLVDWGRDESPLRNVLPTYNESLERHYRFRLKRDAGKIGGRPAHLVAIVPRDRFRYGYRLWLDRENAMPLQCEILNGDDQVIEAVQFASISFGESLPDELFAPRLSTTNYSEVVPPAQPESVVANDQARWRVAEPPPGFTLSVVKRHDTAGMEAEHLVYTDGVASISVFAESYDGKAEVIDGIANIGTANAFGRRVNGFQITVVGEVPAATVERIGKSIEPAR